MLTIRLSRHGRKKLPFYRIVLTEHTKPVKSGYKEVLGWFDPMNDKSDCNIDAIKGWIEKGSQMSSRAAKVVYKMTQADEVKQFIVETHRERTKRKD